MGPGACSPQKIFKIQGSRLPKNAFSEISAWKNWIKVSQHVALLLNLGVSKKLSARFRGGRLPPPPPAAALLFEIKRYVLLVKNPPNPNA